MKTPHYKIPRAWLLRTGSTGLLLFSAVAGQGLKAADWPMYRADAERSGYTSENLPARLRIDWVWKSDSPPQPAWSGRDTRMPFDRAFQPVVADGLVFFGSSSDCTVYALDAETGRERWAYVTDGPVRFAPAVWEDRLFVVSDDGCLYCLAVRDGKLLWKVRGGSETHLTRGQDAHATHGQDAHATGEMVLGNDRLISRWPARGGPVVRDGIVYFGAGLWPSEGIYLYAIDAPSGKTLWVNDSSGDMVIEQPHGGNRAHSGVSIQGYLAMAGDSLAVPTGRATPAFFDARSGRFRYFHLMKLGAGWGNRKGAGPFVSFLDENLYVVEDDVFKASDGRFLARGLPVSSTAFLPDMLIFSRGNEIRAVRKSSLWVEVQEPNAPPVRKLSLDSVAWRITCSDPVGASVVRAIASNEAPDWPQATQTANPPLVVAGRTIIAGTLNNRIITADMDSKSVVTVTELDGLALGLAAADQALYVATDQGTIYRFISAERDIPDASDGFSRRDAETLRMRHEGFEKTSDLSASASLRDKLGLRRELSRSPADAAPSQLGGRYRRMARRIIETTGISEGYCVDIACGDGSLALALAGESRLHIIAIDRDEHQVALARRRLIEAGSYGIRVTVLQRDPANTGLPPHFAGLVVSGRSVTEGAKEAPAEEVKRLLHPHNGVAMVGTSDDLQRTVGEPPADVGEWTHQYADAANTLCSADALAAAPLKMRWFTDFVVQMPSRHGRGPAPLCKDGIMFVEAVHGLLAVDAYTGRRLWFYDIEKILEPYDQEHLVGTAGTGGNMCLAEDSVFVRRENRCLRINMKTGKLVREYLMPGKDGVWGYIGCSGGILFGTSADRTHVVRQLFRNVSEMDDMLTQSRNLFALDVRTGQSRWVYEASDSIRHNAIAVCDGRVYLIDKPKDVGDLPVVKNEASKKRAEDGGGLRPSSIVPRPSVEPAPAGRLVCLDARTGKILWQRSDDIYGTTLAASSNYDVLLMSYQYSQRSYQLPSEKGDRLTGFRTTDGERLWDTTERYISRPIINGSKIYAQPYSYDLLTGQRDPDFVLEGRQPGGCGTITGSTNLLLYRSGTLGYTDLICGSATQNYGPVRPGCWINAIVAGGLVLMPDATDRCTCSYLMKASIALGPAD